MSCCSRSILNGGHGGSVTSRMKYTILYTGHDVRKYICDDIRLGGLAPARPIMATHAGGKFRRGRVMRN